LKLLKFSKKAFSTENPCSLFDIYPPFLWRIRPLSIGSSTLPTITLPQAILAGQ
jgi:hypothetical protein